MSDQANDISGKVSLDTTDYKAGVTEINRQIRVLESGFRASAATMGEWDKTSEGLTLRAKSLSQQIDLQKQKISALTGEYDKIVAEQGESSKAAQEHLIKINRQNEALGKMESELKNNQDALEKMKYELKDSDKALSEVGKESEKTGEKLSDLGKKSAGVKPSISGLKTTLAGVTSVAIGLAAAVAGISAALISTIKPASDLAETQSKVGVVFGESKDEVLDFGKNAANALGMSENAALSAAGEYGNLFRSMGLAEKESTKMSIDLVSLAGDLASFNNMNPTEVLDKLRSGLSGETEPLKSLGVNLNQAMIEQKAFELGLVDVTVSANDVQSAEINLAKATENLTRISREHGSDSLEVKEALVKQKEAEEKLTTARMGDVGELTAAAKAQASYALILKQTSLAQGDFERTSGGLANQQRILSASIENIKASIGTGLLPLVQSTVSGLSGYVSQISTLIGDTTMTVDEKVGQAGNIVTKIVEDITTGLPQVSSAAFEIITAILTGLINAIPKLVPATTKLLTDLVGFIIKQLPILLTAAIQIVVELTKGISEQLPTLIPTIVQAVITIVNTLIQNLPMLIEAAIQLILALAEGLVAALPVLINALPQIMSALVNGLIKVAPMLIVAAAQLIITLGMGIIQNLPKLVTAIVKIIDGIIKTIKATNWKAIGTSMVEGISSGFMAQWESFKANVIAGFGEMVSWIKDLLGIASPSKVFAEMGMNMAGGLGVGFTRQMRTVQNQITMAVGGLTLAASGASSGMNSYSDQSQKYAFYAPVIIQGQTGKNVSEVIKARRY